MQMNVLEYLLSSSARFPDKLAFTDENEALTFSELNSHANALGTHIARQVETANRPVAVLVERSAATIATFMGVLCSGNYYVPIESQMPVKRIQDILQQLQPLAVIYTEDTKKTALALSGFCLISAEVGFQTQPDDNLIESRISRTLDVDPAYIMYTSGSTGVPKGIVISHRSVIDFVDWMADTLDYTADDVMASQVPFFFDPSVKDIYLTMKCSATTHIIPKKLFMFPMPLLEFIAEKKATALNWSTAAFHMVANSKALEKFAPDTVKKVVIGGETMYAKQLNIWRKALPNACYVNAYGPAEVTVDCTYYVIDREFEDHEAIPIGIECRNKEVLLLDENLNPVPVGEIGEIFVRGGGLALGYYGDTEKTDAAFIQNPHCPWYRDILYRTGDIGVMHDDGLITFLTRQDGQIKHSGYRIELGEIETALSALPQMREFACFFDKSHDKIICAYSGEVDNVGIIGALRDRLPKYMYPNIFLKMDNLPRTPNGKIDRVKLKEDYFAQ
ncbi:MAG: amino acid adenylation domain-containing protein [Oscillospiraceae bacterium]|nr:amino acid adenylation domain-containing protein [Oscillospiraceae bacterium]